ncbi:MAG TPA: class I tRNA ligase family protein, partial [Nodosilinea sp.]|nr:class I tRNA ligase family protein [Nodosilinea sp.]
AKDFQTYYPTTTLVTGFDIIFFWVARMTLMAGHFTETMPFETVYIHGLVRDENNKKMSKSSNNGIDPLVLINKYGTVALRYTLIREVTGAGQDIRLEYDRKTDESGSVEASRNFTNKLWNASRFVMMNLEGQAPADLGVPDLENLTLADRWILSRYNRVVQSVRGHLDSYGMGEAAKDLYEFTWGDFCDWYIELVKPRLQGEDAASKRGAQQTLAFVLDGILKLLHPFMPHITEELWHTLTQVGDNEFLAVQPYPTALAGLVDDGLEQQFALVFNTVRTVRNLRAEAGIKPGLRIETILESESAEERHILQATADYIKDLGKIDTLVILGGKQPVSTAHGADSNPLAKLSDNPVVAEVQDFWQTMLPLFEEPLHYAGSFFADIRRPAFTLLWILAVVIVLRFGGAVVAAVDSTPIFGTLMELVGLWVAFDFGRRNLLTGRDRTRLGETYQQWRRDIFGPGGRLTPAAKPAAAPRQPVPVATSAAPLTHTDHTAKPAEPPQKLFAGVTGTVQVLIPLSGVVDIDALRAKVEKDLAKVEAEIKSLSGRLGNPGFVDKAPADVVQGARNALAEAEAQAAILKSRLAML